jgi:hypothetical protein
MRLAIVMLVACSSTPRDPPPPPRAVPVDAAIDAPIPIDATVASYGACNWNKPDSNNPRCAPEHMPLMYCRDVNGPNARFPKCIPDKPPVKATEPIVLKIKRRGEATERGIPIVVDGGTNLGIDQTWRAMLLDVKTRALGGSPSFARVDPDEIELVVRLTSDQLDRAKTVRFSPP